MSKFVLTCAMDKACVAFADNWSLPAALVRAVVWAESAGSAWAWRVEPPYRYLVDVDTRKPFRKLRPEEIVSEKAPGDFNHFSFSSRDTEWWGQQASWGPMQVMGAVAREYGFQYPFPRLCDPYAGVEQGCMHLGVLSDRFHKTHGWAGVVAAYNAGSPRFGDDDLYVNQAYVDKVIDLAGDL